MGVTRGALRRDTDADNVGGLEKSMQTGFAERLGGVFHSLRMESESGRHLDEGELRSREANRCRLSVRKSLIMDVQWAPASLAGRLERRP
jgi:hypothetical protein